MKFTLSWLKRHLDTNASLNEIGEALTSLGLEVEGIEDRAAIYAPFKVAYVESAEKHPDADRLRVCMVKTADHGTLQVVCGAPNARAGMKAVFAPEGSVIPANGLVLKKGKIRGVESNGMMVSMAEMGLSDDHDGIIEAPMDAEIGTPLAEIYGLNDPVIDISLTPNRVDCAGVRGIARDLAAKGLGTLKPLNDTPVKGSFASPVKVSLKDEAGCPLFVGRVVRGVKNGPSPEWLQNLLKAVGLRPISALVDVTNFLSLDLCRPLHVYDVDKLKGDIFAGMSQGGETLEALNDKTYTLPEGCVTINDASGVLGLGGVVGGTSTGCTEATTNVFIESAYFDPMRIAKTGRALGVESDARYRFERGIDPAFTASGMEIATALILELCGGEASEIVTAGAEPPCGKTIAFDPAFTEKLTGLSIPQAQQEKILTALGFEVKGGNVSVPSWRGDIWGVETDGRADLAEEILRVTGFDALPSVSVRAADSVPQQPETELLTRGRKARHVLANRGLSECVTWSFMNKERARLFGSNDNAALAIANPISTEIDQMRPSLLPGLIDSASKNAARGFSDIALCEIGPVFSGTKPEDQKIVAGGIRAGNISGRHWSGPVRAVDAFDAKADALAVLEALGVKADNAQVQRNAPSYYHPGRSGALQLGPNVLAVFGEIHPGVCEKLDIKTPLVGFEVFLNALPTPKKKGGTEKPLLELSPFQPLTRDFAFVVAQDVAADALVKAARAADKKLIVEASVFDVYRGKGVEEGKKSVALTITIQPVEKTLTDEEIEAIAAQVIGQVQQKTGGVLRG
ncbi:MAG: phenylalanine--tRNA ligase subunit beta [Alphaproteobacteria bacterium]|nr:phenylalanine--tRNA ligase subunit beta [Alphaproteobacteria bacterium]